VELLLELLLTQPLSLDERQKQRPSCERQQSVTVEKPRKQEPVESGAFVTRKQVVVAREEVGAPPDDEAQVLPRRPVPPVKAELVHVGDEAEPCLDRLVANRLGPFGPDVVEALLDGRLSIALPTLRRVET